MQLILKKLFSFIFFINLKYLVVSSKLIKY